MEKNRHMTFRILLNIFINEKHDTKNTEVSYERDLRKMNEYLEAQNVYGVSAVTETNLNAYVMFLEREGRKPGRTVSRSIASMKAFFHFLEKERRIESSRHGV